ncbi:unnamed protein product [Lepidochelys olivacea]
MQSPSAEVTMMESQNRKRAPAWTEREVRDLMLYGERNLCYQNSDRGHNRDPKQCRMKLKELRQANEKTREANSRSGSEPKICHFYDELHAILGGSATTTPAVLFDSFNGDGGNTEAGFGDEEDDDDEVVDSSQQASRETGFPDSQELFLTLDLEPVPPNPPKAASRTRQAEKGPLSFLCQCGQQPAKVPASLIAWTGACLSIPCRYKSCLLNPRRTNKLTINSLTWYLNPGYDPEKKEFSDTVLYKHNAAISPAFAGHVRFLGDLERDCSLQRCDLRASENGSYGLRLIASNPRKKQEKTWVTYQCERDG